MYTCVHTQEVYIFKIKVMYICLLFMHNKHIYNIDFDTSYKLRNKIYFCVFFYLNFGILLTSDNIKPSHSSVISSSSE